jgi:hypothetical protein
MLLKNQIKKELKKIGCQDINIKNGYHYFSGFFNYGGNWFYISSIDDRIKQKDFLIRTAKNNKDYIGGNNNFIPFDIDNFKFIGDNIKKFIDGNKPIFIKEPFGLPFELQPINKFKEVKN